MNNIEGNIGNRYWRIFDPEDWDRISIAYQVSEYIPSFKIIGSVDLDALCLRDDGKIYIIPFIPMRAELAEECAKDLNDLRGECEGNMTIVDEKNDTYGLQSHLIKPIAFGGDPVDPDNHTFVPQDKHAELCNFWNKTYEDVKSKS